MLKVVVGVIAPFITILFSHLVEWWNETLVNSLERMFRMMNVQDQNNSWLVFRMMDQGFPSTYQYAN